MLLWEVMASMVYEDIFEALRVCTPNNPVLLMKDREGRGTLQRHLSFEAIQMENGELALMPRTGLNVMFYRGQADAAKRAIPTIYRDAACESIVVDRIKLIDFSMAVEKFPQVQYARKERIQVDTLALAQHYGLKTDMLDLTSDIAVAAFFATTYLDNGIFRPMQQGIGSISCFFAFPGMDRNLPFRVVGLQPFQRPGKQCAFGVKLKQGEDLMSLNCGNTLYFSQNPKYGQMFLDLFGEKLPNELFPEEAVAKIGTRIRNGKLATEKAVKAYCRDLSVPETEVRKLLSEQEIVISKKEAFVPSSKILGQERKKTINNPFGGEKIYQRLMFSPGGGNLDE